LLDVPAPKACSHLRSRERTPDRASLQYGTGHSDHVCTGTCPVLRGYVRRMLADRPSRCQGAERAAARGREPLGRVYFRLRYCRSCLELARPWLRSCQAEAVFAACTPTALGAVVGIAKVDSLAYTVAQTGFKGTPASMSPEQLKVAAPRPSVASHGLGRSCCTDEFTLTTLGFTRTRVARFERAALWCVAGERVHHDPDGLLLVRDADVGLRHARLRVARARAAARTLRSAGPWCIVCQLVCLRGRSPSR
jgi:hypothetical protein